MNKKCVALTEEEYFESINLMHEGFMLDGKYVRPNHRIATIETLQASLGLRISDILQLRMTSFVKDGERWRLDISEKKTSKGRYFTVPVDVYSFIQDYAIKNNIGSQAKLFDITERAVQQHLNKVFSKMGLNTERYGSHSFRKYFSTKIYNESQYNIELVRVLLQHSNVQTTQRYLGIGTKQVEDALASTSDNLVWWGSIEND